MNYPQNCQIVKPSNIFIYYIEENKNFDVLIYDLDFGEFISDSGDVYENFFESEKTIYTAPEIVNFSRSDQKNLKSINPSKCQAFSL